jgi:PTS system nitrogen regulatory IIA component
MKIKESLTPSEVAIDQLASEKAGLLKDLAARAAAALNLPTDAVVEEIAKRDELGSTGIGCGVSIPHARFREVERPLGLLVRLKHPIRIQCHRWSTRRHRLPPPALSQLAQLSALAAIAHKLADRDLLQRLRMANSAAELYQVVTEERTPACAALAAR